MKKLLKFGIVSLSLTVLAGAGLVAEPTVLAETIVVNTDHNENYVGLTVEYIGAEEFTAEGVAGRRIDLAPRDYFHNYGLIGEAKTITAPEFEGWKFKHTYDFINDEIYGGPTVTLTLGEGENDIGFYYERVTPDGVGEVDNQTPPVETPEGEGGGETETLPTDKPVDGGKEIYTNTTNEPIGVAVYANTQQTYINNSTETIGVIVYYIGKDVNGETKLLVDPAPLIEVSPGEEVAAPRSFDGYTLVGTQYLPPAFSEGMLTYFYEATNNTGVDTQTPPSIKSTVVTISHVLVGVSQDSGDSVLLHEDVTLYENGSIFVEPKTFPGTVPVTEPFSLSYDEVVESGVYYTHVKYRPADKTADNGGTATPTPETPQDPSAKEMAAVITGIENLVTELVSLGGTPRHYLPEVIEKVKAGDVQAYKAYDFANIKADLLEQIAEAKKVTETSVPTPAPETPEERQARINHNLRVLRSEVERVERALTYPKLTPAEVAALQAFKAKRLETIASLEQTGELGDDNLTEADIKAFDKVLALELAGVFNDKDAEQPVPTPTPKDLAADRNKLLLSVDESGLTDQQKGDLAVKITFAETEKDLADLKAELVKLVKAAEKPANKPAKEAPKTESKAPAVAAKPAANAPAKSDKAALPATGDVTRVGLIAAGFSLLLLGLGLAKSRKHN